jgi:hypothetical protein
MELLRELQAERVVPMVALMDWVEEEAVHLELARVEVESPVLRPVPLVALLEQVRVRLLEAARDEVLADPVVQPELALAEAQPWDPTYRVIRK